MALTLSALRQRLAVVLEAVAGVTESRYPFELFGRDFDQVTHKGFALGITSTDLHEGDRRQRVSEGAYIESLVECAWAYRLRGDDQRGSYDAALDHEQALIQALLAATRADLHIRVTGMTRRTVPEGWVLGVTRYAAITRYALQ
jgi:hypothetical protein